MSIGGVHAEHGWSEFSLDDAAVKQAGLGQAARTVAVADATKLGVRAFSQVASLGAAGTFVTDEAAADASTHPNGPRTLDALGDDPAGLAANVRAMNETALALFRAGHLPVTGEALALPLIETAGSARPGDPLFDEIFHPIAA